MKTENILKQIEQKSVELKELKTELKKSLQDDYKRYIGKVLELAKGLVYRKILEVNYVGPDYVTFNTIYVDVSDNELRIDYDDLMTIRLSINIEEVYGFISEKQFNDFVINGIEQHKKNFTND